ncbi:MAG TPA: transcription elongation factor GreA [Anaerolineales bacterium]|nr:transcription elongation factor GreA [Anaerolineales bacterium]
MEEKKLYLTPEGAAKLREELKELTGPRRKAMAERLHHAVRQGDLSENADYITAKEDQAFLEGRILELQTLLREAVIVEGNREAGVVDLGSQVVVSEGEGKSETFVLVGLKEADPRNGKISHESPIGRALMGKRVGETAVAQTPGGELRFRILEIKARGG